MQGLIQTLNVGTENDWTSGQMGMRNLKTLKLGAIFDEKNYEHDYVLNYRIS